MADRVKFQEVEDGEKDRVRQIAFKVGRKNRGEPSRLAVVDAGVEQAYVNTNWNWISRAWKAGATPKPNPRPKPKGLGFSNKE